mgnify:CR=1 FL=1
MIKKEQSKGKMDIVDIEKLHAQYKAGLSLHKLSEIHNLPYVSLYRAIKEYEKNKIKE